MNKVVINKDSNFMTTSLKSLTGAQNTKNSSFEQVNGKSSKVTGCKIMDEHIKSEENSDM